ncbi:MAG: acyltransferase [Rhizobiales bacterium]|nr:acyltransferase [Hyphomicrobiales bacterium]
MAILLVVVFHLGLGPVARSGFVGVDVFFVISGFLIIGQILADERSGNFRLSGFWMRRVLRIGPPYLIVVVCSVVISLVVLVEPREFRDFAWSAFWAALMNSNHYFLVLQGYFDTDATTKPLLHTWSLAVEEQFYLAAPLVLIAWLKLRRRMPDSPLPDLLLAALMAASFASSVLLTGGSRNLAFYLTPARAWEFAAGGLAHPLAGLLRRMPRGALQAMALAAAGGLVASGQLLDAAAFPSGWAMLPVASTALLISSGIAMPDAFVPRALSTWPMQRLGDVSYEWYLWHWPLLCFARIGDFGRPDVARDIGAVLLALALAVLTHAVLRRPIAGIRSRMHGERDRWSVVAAGALFSILVAVGTLSGLFAAANRAAATVPVALQQIFGPISDRCALAYGSKIPVECVRPSGPRTLVVGDSYAMRMFPAVRETFRKMGRSSLLVWSPGCAPFRNLTESGWAGAQQCATARARLPAMLNAIGRIDGGVDSAFVAVDWSFYLAHVRHDPKMSAKDGIAGEISNLLAELRQVGVRRVVVLGPYPKFRYRAVPCLARAWKYGLPADVCAVPTSDWTGFFRDVQEQLDEVEKQVAEMKTLRVSALFCDPDWCRPFISPERPLVIDNGHPSDEGAREMLARKADIVRWLVTGNPVSK